MINDRGVYWFFVWVGSEGSTNESPHFPSAEAARKAADQLRPTAVRVWLYKFDPVRGMSEIMP